MRAFLILVFSSILMSVSNAQTAETRLNNLTAQLSVQTTSAPSGTVAESASAMVNICFFVVDYEEFVVNFFLF